MAYIPSYYEGLLSEDDMSSLRNQALASGLLSAGAAFSRAGAPSMMPQGSGFSEALQGFQGGYQGQIDSALQNMIKANNVEDQTDLIRNLKHSQVLRNEINNMIMIKAKYRGDEQKIAEECMNESNFLFTYLMSSNLSLI